MGKKLSIFGKVVQTMEGNPEPTGEKKFDWSDAIIDSAILAGITFFGTLGGVSCVMAQSQVADKLIAAFIAASIQFLTVLGIKRKLIKED